MAEPEQRRLFATFISLARAQRRSAAAVEDATVASGQQVQTWS
jgi:hypothetical protein